MARAANSNDLREDGLLAAVLMVWGFNTVLTKIGLRELDVLALMFIRNSTTLVVLLAIFVGGSRAWPKRPADIKRILLVGLVGVTMNQVFYNMALHYTSAANASLLGSTSPIFGLIVARIFEGESSTRRRWVGAAIGFLGVALVVAGGQGTVKFGLDSIVGDLLMLGCSLSWALFILIGRPLLKTSSPVELTLFAYLAGVPLMVPVTAGAMLAQPWAAVALVGWATALGIGLNNAIANAILYRSVGKVGASKAMMFFYLSPVAGVTLAMLLLHESLSITQVVGAVVVLVGVNTARTG